MLSARRPGGCRERWAQVAMARSASHFRANVSWHRMLWPENLTAQECCAHVSSGYAHLAGRPRTHCTLLVDCEQPQATDTPSLKATHTGSLVISQSSRISWHTSRARVFSGPNPLVLLRLLPPVPDTYLPTTPTWGPEHSAGHTAFRERWALGLHTSSSLTLKGLCLTSCVL